MTSPRLRATLVLTLLWAVTGAGVGFILGLVNVFRFGPHRDVPVAFYLTVYSCLGAVMGFVAGGLFTAALATVQSEGGVDGLRAWRWGLRGGFFGAISGLIGFIALALVIKGTIPPWSQEMLVAMLTGTGVGSVAGMSFIAIARRATGPALGSGARELLEP